MEFVDLVTLFLILVAFHKLQQGDVTTLQHF